MSQPELDNQDGIGYNPNPTPEPIDLKAVQNLASAFLDVVENQNPDMQVLMTALSATTVAFMCQFVMVGTGELTHEEVTKQLARFYSYSVDLASEKVKTLNEQITSQKLLEEYATTFKRVTGAED